MNRTIFSKKIEKNQEKFGLCFLFLRFFKKIRFKSKRA